MTNDAARGRFVWHELMTPSPAQAHAFYKKALGWSVEPWQGDPSYTMFAAPSGPLGAAVASTTGAPHWVPYVATPDIDATVSQAVQLGANITLPPTAIPNGSRYATLTDPQGARVAVYESGSELGPEVAPRPGEFCWHELAAIDYRSAFGFYTALFGWESLAEHDMGPMGVYLIFGRNGTQLGGMFSKGDSGLPGAAYWLGYVRVADINEALRNVKAARGTLVHGPMVVPTGEWIAQFTDSQGALLAVHALASAAPAKQKPAAKKAAMKKTAKKKKRTAAKKKTKKAPAKRRTAKKRPGAKKVRKKGAKKKPAAKKARKKGAKKRSPAKSPKKKRSRRARKKR